MASHYHTLKPHFSENHGDNIALEKDGAQNCFKAEWKFLKSYGHAFSDFPLRDDRMYEANFDGSGHASIGLTQTDPNHLSDLQQAVRNNQIVLVTDVRFHKRKCTVDIVKKAEGRKTFVFQTKYKDSAPQGKNLMPNADVWIVFYLKFGENMTAEIRDKETGAALRFHKKIDRNIDLQNERLKVSLRSPFPLAYAVLENSLEENGSIHVKTEHINNEEKPRLYHVKIGISNKNADSANSLEFCPSISTKLERDHCIGDFFICMPTKGKFHVFKDGTCIYTKTISPEVDVNLPVYLSFEIFRLRLQTVEFTHCAHKSDAIQNPEGNVVGDSPYVRVNELLKTLQGVNQEVGAGKYTVELEKTLTVATTDLEKYVNYFSDDGYLTPLDTPKPKRVSAAEPIEHQDESSEQPSLKTLQMKLIQIEKTAKEHHFERQTSLVELMKALEINRAIVEKIQSSVENISSEDPTPRVSGSSSFQMHLQKTCADFIQNVDVFPLCDYLLQFDIIHKVHFQNLLDESRRQRTEASRTLFNILSKKKYTDEELEKVKCAFLNTKQEHLLPQ
ncbi:uncharacterized protein LOC134266839 [Saccostrea cucullata]|uniref:uncharacterized protein LOC134266839 n=1 Tax=Saccostrea cuccullata TaxID=36930 RepID=UPI002ED23FEF